LSVVWWWVWGIGGDGKLILEVVVHWRNTRTSHSLTIQSFGRERMGRVLGFHEWGKDNRHFDSVSRQGRSKGTLRKLWGNLEQMWELSSYKQNLVGDVLILIHDVWQLNVQQGIP
jgi:hypothetical protein